jgi:RimJ/RimL family protein N-acetyltransferase
MLGLPYTLENTALRRLQVSDLVRFHAYRANAELARYQGWAPMTHHDAAKFLATMSDVSGLRYGEWLQLGIAEHPASLLVGDLGLCITADNTTAEIGFTLHHDHHGQGHATRAVNLAVQLILEHTAVTAIEAITDSRNAPSIAVLDRSGFSVAKVQPAFFKGESCTELVYRRERVDN